MYLDLHVKCPTFLTNFNKIWLFMIDFNKTSPVSNSTKIRPTVEDEMIYAESYRQKERHDERERRYW